MLVVFPRIVSDNGPLTCLLFSIPEYLSLVRADGEKKSPHKGERKRRGYYSTAPSQRKKKGIQIVQKGEGGMKERNNTILRSQMRRMQIHQV